MVGVEANQRIGRSHIHCFACGCENEDGLGLVFERTGDQRVRAACLLDQRYEGYPGVVQGGIVATILDCAMTNCLFADGVEAMTVRLNVQYSLPTRIGAPFAAEARLIRRRGRMYELEASLIQQGHLTASASGVFLVPKN